MEKLSHILFLSCLKASELVEKRFHFKLSVREQMQLKMHMLMCKGCTQHEHQSTLIEKGITKLKEKEVNQEEMNSLKKKISQKIKDCS